MKPTSSSARLACLLAVFAALPTRGQAHPGHSALDWFSTLPHFGHASEYAVILNALAVLILAAGVYWLGSRKR